jgi:predicted nucleic acid-binding Zn ribbon protein
MPTYLYECSVHGEFEEEHSIKITLEDCPKCQVENLTPQKLKPLISGGSGRGIVELTGQDLVDKCRDDARKIKDEASRDAKKYANLLGEDRYHQLQTRIDRQKSR